LETYILNTCDWALTHQLNQIYHDEEWGVPCFDDQKLFEFLILEGAQAGLNWLTVLKKREHYRKVYQGFNPEKIARFNQRKIDSLLKDPGIIRNKLKVASAKQNAKAYLKLQETTSLSDVLWDFVDGKPIVNRWKKQSQVPAKTDISDQMSKELKRLGFNFVGSTICYAFMQAMGLVNDHLITCKRHKACLLPKLRIK
jgi:DNA-3-methyladenine glycosylase I